MRTLYTILCVLALAGCSGFLEEYSQDKAYVKSWEDLDELMLGNAYFTPVYIQNGWWSEGTTGKFYYPWIHVLADELTQIMSGKGSGRSNGASFVTFGYHTWQFRVYEDPAGQKTWDDAADFRHLYSHINACNMILNEIVPFEKAATEEYDLQNIRRIQGECHFLRAACYFMLVNFYGKPYDAATAVVDPAVPLKLTHYVEDKYYSRNSVAEVYEQIVSDLTEAESLLKDVPRKSPWRADVNAVRLLLSRTYLYMCNYAGAQKYAAMVTAGGPALENLNHFNGESFLTPDLSELIFSMGSTSIFGSVTIDDNYGYSDENYRVSDELYSAYDPVGGHDLRLQHYVVRRESDKTLRYKKLKGSTFSTPAMSDIFIMRTSEAYLNLAEAAACNDDEATARQALRMLRENRIDATFFDAAETDALSGERLVQFIRDERQRELCLEGHRWFDLRRYRVAACYPQEVTMEHIFAAKSSEEPYGIIWRNKYVLPSDDPAWVLPLPVAELDKNTGMIDNPRNERIYQPL